jgi:hypothetical protein
MTIKRALLGLFTAAAEEKKTVKSAALAEIS